MMTVEEPMGRLRDWVLDWIDRSRTEPSDRKIDDPVSLLQRIFAALAGIIAIFSSPAIGFLVPNLNANAALVLRIIVALVILTAVNHVVTAKDTVEAGATGSRPRHKYRFSPTERLIARGVVAAAILVSLLNLVPAPAPPPQDCSLTATVNPIRPLGSARLQFLALNAGGRETRYPAVIGRPIAIKVPAGHILNYAVALQWSDNSRSEFDALSGCPAELSKDSSDGRAKIDFRGR
jgi:hypothetical protein